MASDPSKGIFALPENAQADSRLLQLPSEIQLRILQQLLLKNSAPLTSALPHSECCMTCGMCRQAYWEQAEYFDMHNAWKPGGRNFSFAPSVLATCQTFCYQGYQVLYGDNEAVMEVCVSPYGGKINVCTFDCSIDMRFALSPKEAGIWKCMRRFRLNFCYWMDDPAVSSPAPEPGDLMVQRFAESCKMVTQAIPEHAIITISVKFPGSDLTKQRESFFRYCLPSIGILRCAELRFDETVPEVRATPICNVVTSNTDILDLPMIASATHRWMISENGKAVLAPTSHGGGLEGLDSGTIQIMHDMWDAVQVWDVEKFADARRQLQSKCENALAELANPSNQSSRIKNDQMKNIIDELRCTFADVPETDFLYANIRGLRDNGT